MTRTHLRISSLLSLAVVTIVGGVYLGDADARGGRGGGGMRGGGGGGMRAGGGGGARTSVSRSPSSFSGGGARSAGSINRGAGAARSTGGYNRGATAGGLDRGAAGTRDVSRTTASRDVNRNTNRNVNRDVNVHGDHGYYHGGRYYGGAPIARAAAATAAVGLTAAAIGSVAYSLPAGCGSYVYGASPYYNCGGVYYAPQYSGTDVTYIVVENPDE